MLLKFRDIIKAFTSNRSNFQCERLQSIIRKQVCEARRWLMAGFFFYANFILMHRRDLRLFGTRRLSLECMKLVWNWFWSWKLRNWKWSGESEVQVEVEVWVWRRSMGNFRGLKGRRTDGSLDSNQSSLLFLLKIKLSNVCEWSQSKHRWLIHKFPPVIQAMTNRQYF